jgi:hypothetical protein
MTLMEVLSLLFELFKSTMREVFILSEEKIKELLIYFVNSPPAFRLRHNSFITPRIA